MKNQFRYDTTPLQQGYVTPAAAHQHLTDEGAEAARLRMLDRMGIREGESSSAAEARERMIQRMGNRSETTLDKD